MITQNVTFFGAFLAGFLSFLSPCILPLIPSYIAFISGVSLLDAQQGKIKILSLILPAIFFVLGFSTVFIGLGAVASSIGNFLFLKSDLFAKIGGGIIIILSLITAGVINLPFLKYEQKFRFSKSPVGFLGAFLVGIVFAFGWSPCVGPILAAILAFASQQDTIGQGVNLLIVYSAGLAIPFLIVPFILNPFIKIMSKMGKYLIIVEIISGKLLLTMGILLSFGILKEFTGTMGGLSIISILTLIIFILIIVTQIILLVRFVNNRFARGIYEFSWKTRLLSIISLFVVDIVGIGLIYFLGVIIPTPVEYVIMG